MDIGGGASDDAREDDLREEAKRVRKDVFEPGHDGRGEAPRRTRGPGAAGHRDPGEAAAGESGEGEGGRNMRRGLIEEVEAVRDRVKELTSLEDPTTEERAEMLRHAETMAVLAQEMAAVAEKHEKGRAAWNKQGAKYDKVRVRDAPPPYGVGGRGERRLPGGAGSERTVGKGEVNVMVVRGENDEGEDSVPRSSSEHGAHGPAGEARGGHGRDEEEEEGVLEREMSRLLVEMQDWEKEQERDSMEKSARIR